MIVTLSLFVIDMSLIQIILILLQMIRHSNKNYDNDDNEVQINNNIVMMVMTKK